jgi:hypothetical protein
MALRMDHAVWVVYASHARHRHLLLVRPLEHLLVVLILAVLSLLQDHQELRNIILLELALRRLLKLNLVMRLAAHVVETLRAYLARNHVLDHAVVLVWMLHEGLLHLSMNYFLF